MPKSSGPRWRSAAAAASSRGRSAAAEGDEVMTPAMPHMAAIVGAGARQAGLSESGCMVSSIHVLGSHQLGGADRFFIRLVKALQRAGHPSLAVIRADSPVGQVLSPEIEQVHLPMASKWDLFSRWRLTRLIGQRQPDVVQTYMGRATRLTRLPAGSRALHVARLGGYYKIDGYYRHAHAWVGNTQDICDFLVKQGLPRERVFYIGNFVPQPRAVAPRNCGRCAHPWGCPTTPSSSSRWAGWW